MKRMAVVAIGSRLMRDDGIGIEVAEAIRENLLKEHIDVVIAETDAFYGMQALRAYDQIIVLDAMESCGTPGKVTVTSFAGAGEKINACPSLHEMSLIELLLMEHLAFSLIGIEAEIVGIGMGLSKALTDNFEAICKTTQREIVKIKRCAEEATVW